MFGMRRREFIGLLGGAAAAWPLAARAQQPAMVRQVGVLMGPAESDPEGQSEIVAFRQGLQKLGWTGRNVRIAYRWAAGDADRMRTFASELIALKPDAVLAVTTPAVAALLGETRSIPIVFVRVADPIRSGFVNSLAHPGGNVSGFSNFESSLAGKWLQLLKEIAPRVARVTVMFNPVTAPSGGLDFLRLVEAAAPSLAVEVSAARVHDVAEIERVVAAVAREPNSLLLVAGTPVWDLLLCAKHLFFAQRRFMAGDAPGQGRKVADRRHPFPSCRRASPRPAAGRSVTSWGCSTG
jgi:putative tryptophan/tyrosine transport system substrate-binding protein